MSHESTARIKRRTGNRLLSEPVVLSCCFTLQMFTVSAKRRLPDGRICVRGLLMFMRQIRGKFDAAVKSFKGIPHNDCCTVAPQK